VIVTALAMRRNLLGFVFVCVVKVESMMCFAISIDTRGLHLEYSHVEGNMSNVRYFRVAQEKYTVETLAFLGDRTRSIVLGDV
jgi:hypothetical protein